MLHTTLTPIHLAARADRTTTLLRRLTAALPGRPVLPHGDGVVVLVPDHDRVAVAEVLVSLVGGLLEERAWPLGSSPQDRDLARTGAA